MLTAHCLDSIGKELESSGSSPGSGSARPSQAPPRLLCKGSWSKGRGGLVLNCKFASTWRAHSLLELAWEIAKRRPVPSGSGIRNFCLERYSRASCDPKIVNISRVEFVFPRSLSESHCRRRAECPQVHGHSLPGVEEDQLKSLGTRTLRSAVDTGTAMSSQGKATGTAAHPSIARIRITRAYACNSHRLAEQDTELKACGPLRQSPSKFSLLPGAASTAAMA